MADSHRRQDFPRNGRPVFLQQVHSRGSSNRPTIALKRVAHGSLSVGHISICQSHRRQGRYDSRPVERLSAVIFSDDDEPPKSILNAFLQASIPHYEITWVIVHHGGQEVSANQIGAGTVRHGSPKSLTVGAGALTIAGGAVCRLSNARAEPCPEKRRGRNAVGDSQFELFAGGQRFAVVGEVRKQKGALFEHSSVP